MNIQGIRNFLAGLVMAVGSMSAASVFAAEEIRHQQESQQRLAQVEAIEEKLASVENKF